MVQDSKVTTWGGAAGWKIEAQCKGGVRDGGITHRRGGREAQFARGGI